MWNLKSAILAAVALGLLAVSLTAGSRPGPSQIPTPPPTPTPTPTPQPSAVGSWLVRLLGIDPKVYERLTRVRPDDTDAGAGERLMKLNLQTEQETEIWKCGGCWSPVRVGDAAVAVLKSDGVWLVPAPPAAPRLAVSQRGLTAIIGPLPDQPRRLLLIAETGKPQCRYAPRVADLSDDVVPDSNRLQDPPGAPPTCFNNAQDVMAAIKASRTRNNKLLSDTRHKGVNLRLSQLTRATVVSTQPPPPQPAPLTPRLNDLDDGVGRFSPNWLNDQEVVYVALP